MEDEPHGRVANFRQPDTRGDIPADCLTSEQAVRRDEHIVARKLIREVEFTGVVGDDGVASAVEPDARVRHAFAGLVDDDAQYPAQPQVPMTAVRPDGVSGFATR